MCKIIIHPRIFQRKFNNSKRLGWKIRRNLPAGAQKSRLAPFLEAESLVFLDFIDPARASQSDPVGATKKSSPYGTIKISSPTRKSAVELPGRSQLGTINTRMKDNIEVFGRRTCFWAPWAGILYQLRVSEPRSFEVVAGTL